MTRVAVLQMDCVEGDRQRNQHLVAESAREARDGGATVLALPELWCSGYDLESATRETWGQAELEFLCALSVDPGIAILGGSLLQPDGGGRYANTAVACEAGAVLTRYSKLHLFRPLHEDRHLVAGGERTEPFSIAGLKCATVICYDLRFPEVFRGPALAGVDLIYVPAQWPVTRIQHWEALLVARAIESQCYVLGVNRRGRFGETEFGGRSLLVGPWGDIRFRAGEATGVFCVDFEAGEAQEARARLPVLRDRREDLYPLQ